MRGERKTVVQLCEDSGVSSDEKKTKDCQRKTTIFSKGTKERERESTAAPVSERMTERERER